MAAYISFQPSDFFNTKLYTGTGASNAITGVGFQPDVTWIKTRGVSESHVLFDSPRTNGYYLKPDATSSPIDGGPSGSNLWTSFDSDGFTVNSTGARTNTNTYTYVSWNWKAGTTSGIATNGSTTITPTAYSFSQTAGISTFTFTGNATGGARIAHGLGKTPDFFFLKSNDAGQPFIAWHKDMTTPAEDYFVGLNSSTEQQTATWAWNDESPDATNIVVSNNAQNNGSGTSVYGHCFTGIKGYSKFGFYDGNGNADGPFVYTGFRPAYILFKQRNVARDWIILDNKRNVYNPVINQLKTNDPAAESTDDDPVDFLSNGFKIRTTKTWYNDSAAYVYAAFAEFPLVSSNSKAGVAR